MTVGDDFWGGEVERAGVRVAVEWASHGVKHCHVKGAVVAPSGGCFSIELYPMGSSSEKRPSYAGLLLAARCPTSQLLMV